MPHKRLQFESSSLQPRCQVKRSDARSMNFRFPRAAKCQSFQKSMSPKCHHISWYCSNWPQVKISFWPKRAFYEKIFCFWRIQCPTEKIFHHSITFYRINAYVLHATDIVAHVNIMTPICPHQGPFSQLIRTLIITIDWVLWKRYGLTKEKVQRMHQKLW